MKASITENKQKFNPVTLSITLETKEELMNFWARMIICNDDVIKCLPDNDKNSMRLSTEQIKFVDTWGVWNVTDTIAKENNLVQHCE